MASKRSNVTPRWRSKKCQSEVYVGDCLNVMHTLEGQSVDLVFADPPFNLGQKYVEHHDVQPDSVYGDWTRQWVFGSTRLVREGGSIFVHCHDDFVDIVSLTLKEAGLHRVNWIVLHQEFGQHTDRKFIPSHNHLLWFCRGEHYTFNVDDVLEPSRRASVYGDTRVMASPRKGMRPFLDVWYGPYLGRVQGNNAERMSVKNGALVNHPNQLPEMYLARIIRAASNPGDLVLDPFLGSGTTLTVAAALKRQGLGIEKGKRTAESAWNRVTKKGPVRDVQGALANGGSRAE